MASFLDNLEGTLDAAGREFLAAGLAALAGRPIELASRDGATIVTFNPPSSSLGNLTSGQPPDGPITSTEQAVANAVIKARPTSVATSIVPAPLGTRTALMTDGAWFANVTYWLVYRSAENPWRKAGNPPGPATFQADSPWADRWKTIYAYVQLALSLGADNIPPLGKEPTQFEEDAAAFYMQQGGEPGDFTVDPTIVPPPYNERKPGTDPVSWATNVVYWLVYTYPDSVWVSTGHAPAPIVIPDAESVWVPVWVRIHELMNTYR